MGSKAYKGKTCIYCVQSKSSTADHVIARSFFLPEKRQGIPKVPACKTCNGRKSKLEHYLTAVVPFGGRHPDSERALVEQVSARLEKNRKLAQELRDGWKPTKQSASGDDGGPDVTLPFDSERFVEYMEMVVRGLAWHYWNLLFERDCTVQCATVSEQGAQLMSALYKNGKHRDRIAEQFADGAFVFEAIRSTEGDQFTVWRMQFYGIILSGDSDSPQERSGEVYAITYHRESPAASAAQALLGP